MSERRLYIGRATLRRMQRRMEIGDPKGTAQDIVTAPDGRLVVSFENPLSTLSTSLENYLHNDPEGIFWVGKNKQKLGRILRKAWGIEDPTKIDYYIKEWDFYYIDSELAAIKVSTSLSKVYNMDHHSSCRSCMVHKGYYYKLLDAEPDVKIAYMTDDEAGEIIGRAILWENLEVTDSGLGHIKLMDRIYYKDDQVLAIFKKWAGKQGYWHKERQSFEHKREFISPNNERHSLSLDFHPTQDWRDGEYPYMDTMSFADGQWKILSNNEEELAYNLDSTGGGYSHIGEDQGYCEYCQEYYDLDTLTYIEGYGTVCEHCLAENFVLCTDSDEYVGVDDAYYCSTDGNYYAETDELVRIGDKLFHRDDPKIFYCEYCDEYHHKGYSEPFDAIIKRYAGKSYYCFEETTVCSYAIQSGDYTVIVGGEDKLDPDLDSFIKEYFLGEKVAVPTDLVINTKEEVA